MAKLTSTLTMRLIDDVTKPARSVAQALKDAERNAKQVAKAMATDGARAGDKFVKSLSGLKLSAKDIEEVAKSWKDYSKAAGLAAKASDWTKAQVADVRRWESQTISALRSVKREQQAFARSVAAAGTAGVGPIAAAMSANAIANARLKRGMSAPIVVPSPTEMHNTGQRAKNSKRGGGSGAVAASEIGAAEVAAAGGLLGRMGLGHVAAGYGAYKAGEHFVRSGAEYQHEQIALENAGRTKHELEEAEARAREISKQLPTSTMIDNLKVINETTGAFGDFHHALDNLPFMQKTASVLKAAAGDKIRADAGELGNKFARFFELRGTAGDTPTFQKEAGEMVRAMAFTRGNFNPEEMLHFAQQAGSGLQNYSMRFLSRIAPAIVTEVGGERAGTGASAWRNTILGKARDKKQAEMWTKLGLLDPKEVIPGKNGPIGWRAGAVKGTNVALQDPLKWTEEVLLPAMEKAKIETSNSLEVTKALNQLFRNENANRFANIIGQLKSRQRLHKDEANIEKAGDLDTIYNRNVATDPTVAVSAVSAAWDNLGTALTKALPIAKTINELADAINILGDVVTDPKKWGESTLGKWKRVGEQAKNAAGSFLDKYLMKPGAFVSSKPNENARSPAFAKPMTGTDYLAGPYGPKGPNVETKSVVFAKEKADEASEALDALNKTVSPVVSTTSADAAIAKWRELLSIINAVEAAGNRAANSAKRAATSVPSLGKVQRGNFAYGGIQGE